MRRHFKSIWVVFVCLVFISNAPGAIRVVAWNCANHPNNTTQDGYFRTILEAIGDESVNGIAKRLDILVMSEMDDSSALRLVNILNTLYSVNTYTPVLSTSAGGDKTGVIYDSSTVTLIRSEDLTSIGIHPILRAQFLPGGSTAANEQFTIYAIHLKSGDTPADKSQRSVEAANLRANADSLGQGTAIIYAGDFNLNGSSEGAWPAMLAPGSGQAFDPADTPGDWRDDPAFIQLHSQDPGGSLDDRFDFQFITDELMDDSGIEYVDGSFHVFGNNGTHTLNSTITTGTGASTTVLNALTQVSDHLPVVADYEIVQEPGSDLTLKQQIIQRINQLELELTQLRTLVDQLPD